MRKLTEQEKEKRRQLAERLRDRRPPSDWREDIGAPYFSDDSGQAVSKEEDHDT